MTYVRVGAAKKSPQSTLMECRLPVKSIVRGLQDKNLFDPYEVATVYLDGFTNKRGTWRAQLIINFAKNTNGVVWLITVRDEDTKIDLLTATLKEPAEKQKVLFVKGQGEQLTQDLDDLLPLERIGSTAPGSLRGPRSVWDWIRAIQYDSADE